MRFSNLFLATLLTTTTFLHASGWTVSSTDSTARFHNLQAAIDAASEGDTLHLGIDNFSGVLAKRLVLIGQQASLHPRNSGSALTVQLKTGSSGAKILNVAYLDAQFVNPGISQVEIGYCGVDHVTGSDVLAMWFHHNVPVGSNNNGEIKISGTGNVFSNSYLSGADVSGSNALRHVLVINGVAGYGSVFDSSVVFDGDRSCENCHFQSSMLTGSTYPAWNSYRDTVVDSAWVVWEGSGWFPASSVIGFTGGKNPLILDSEGYNIPQSPYPALMQVNLERSKLSPTDSVRVWIRANRPAGVGK